MTNQQRATFLVHDNKVVKTDPMDNITKDMVLDNIAKFKEEIEFLETVVLPLFDQITEEEPKTEEQPAETATDEAPQTDTVESEQPSATPVIDGEVVPEQPEVPAQPETAAPAQPADFEQKPNEFN